MPRSKLKIPATITLLVHLLVFPALGTDPGTSSHALTQADLAAFSMSTKELGNVREYYSSNKDNRFLIKVHIWGDTPLSGIHYIPDNSTLLDAVSYSGGPTGSLSGSTLTLHRLVPSKDGGSVSVETKIDGNSLASKGEYVNYPLLNGDILYLEAPSKTDNLARNLGILASILGVISTSVTIYLVTRH